MLASGAGKEGPGPLVSMFGGAVQSIPVTIVPGNFTEAQIDALAWLQPPPKCHGLRMRAPPRQTLLPVQKQSREPSFSRRWTTWSGPHLREEP